MAISDKTRRDVMERDKGECQFWCGGKPATQFSHFDHQGIGGLPTDHPKNQPENGAASCDECHARFSGPGRVYVWEEFEPANIKGMDVGGPVGGEMLMLMTGTNNMDDAYRVMKNDAIEANKGRMVIRAPNGKLVPESDLWFYVRWDWFWAEDQSECLRAMIQRERHAAWKVAEYLAWFKSTGTAPAVGSEDYLDLGASLGLSSAEVKKRVRVNKFRDGSESMNAIDIDVADRLRNVPESDIIEVAGWFAELPQAEAWSRFNERYPGPEKRKKYRIFTGTYREVEAATDDEIDAGGGVVVKGGSVIAGVRKEVEDVQALA